jgi:Ras family protein T1
MPVWKASLQDRPHLESEIRKAHVICVVYAIDNPNSFDRIPTYWLPHFRQLGVNVPITNPSPGLSYSLVFQVPVVLVGNKIDLRGGEVTNEALEDEIVPIMNEFKVGFATRHFTSPLIPELKAFGLGSRDVC